MQSAGGPARHKPAYQATLLAKAERIGERALAWSRAAIDECDVRAYRLLQGMVASSELPKHQSTRSQVCVLRRTVRNASR